MGRSGQSGGRAALCSGPGVEALRERGEAGFQNTPRHTLLVPNTVQHGTGGDALDG